MSARRGTIIHPDEIERGDKLDLYYFADDDSSKQVVYVDELRGDTLRLVATNLHPILDGQEEIRLIQRNACVVGEEEDEEEDW